MQIAIIGAGAVGLLFASYLHQAGHDVTLYTRTIQQAEDIRQNGITRMNREQSFHFNVKAEVLSERTSFHHTFVIVAVKQYDLNEIVPLLQHNAPRSALLFVQNGMGHLPLLAKLTNRKRFVGVVEHGALKQSNTKVCHTGVGIVKIAAYCRQINEADQKMMRSWHQRHFPIAFVTDSYQMLAEKLVTNAVINPLTAIFRVKNGELMRNPYFFQLMRQLFNETVAVLDVEADKLWDHVRNVCQQTGENQSSMLRDIRLKRRTEIDAISGYILQLAEEQGKTLPITSFIVSAVKGLESGNREDEAISLGKKSDSAILRADRLFCEKKGK